MVASVAVDFPCNYKVESVIYLPMSSDYDEDNLDDNELAGIDDIEDLTTEENHTPRRPKSYKPSSRARTIAPKELLRAHKKRSTLPVDEESVYPDDIERPIERADCLTGGINEQRPCPFVSCAHHLYLDANDETGALKMNFPHLEVWEMSETCVLDVADRGGITLEEVGEIMNLTRERIRQVEVRGLAKAAFEYEYVHGCRDCGADLELIEDQHAGRRIISCTVCDREIAEPM